MEGHVAMKVFACAANISRVAVAMFCLSLPARAGDAGVLLSYACDEAMGSVLEDTGPNAAAGSLNAQRNGRVSGGEVLVTAADVWMPILTSEGVQHKNLVAGSEAILADGERPIVLDRDRDYAIDYEKGLIKALPGGRMEVERASTIDFQYNNAGAQHVAGKIGRGLQLDGVDDFVTLGHVPAATQLNAATLSLWVDLAQNSSPDAIILAKNAVEKNGASYGLRLVRGVLQFFHSGLKTAGGKTAAPTQAKEELPRAAWLLLTATYDGASTRLYVNGHEVAHQTALAGDLEASGDFTIGGVRDPNFLGGLVDEVEIYQRALSPAEIARRAGTH
jgi:hypothetical protein